jgi:hypothetical protein
MDVAEPVRAPEHRRDHVGLLDVHVVGVQVHVHVGAVDLVQELERLPGGVEQVGLVAVDDLDAEGDP